jgi:hypothetical protein
MLAKRLGRRGVALSGGMLATIISQQTAMASVPATVTSNTIHAAGQFMAGSAVAVAAISPQVSLLTDGVKKSMLVSKLKGMAVVALVIGAWRSASHRRVFFSRATRWQSTRAPAPAADREPAQKNARRPSRKKGRRCWALQSVDVKQNSITFATSSCSEEMRSIRSCRKETKICATVRKPNSPT